jgi:transcriptional regulator with XRE-family HTH domain
MARTFGERLRSALERAGLRQIDLANRLDCTRGMVSQWATGHRTPTRPEDIVRIAKAIGCDPSDLHPLLASKQPRR